ncbi:hypothetical protein ABFS83_14G051400 [Erythranthe nasuta]
MEEFCRSAMKKHGDRVVTDIQRIDTTSKTMFSMCPDVDGAEFFVQIFIANASDVSFQFLKKDSDQPQIVTSALLPEREDYVVFDSDKFSSHEHVRRDVTEILENLIMTPSLRQGLVGMALDTAYSLVKSRPLKHNLISIRMRVYASFKIDFDGRIPRVDDKLLIKEVEEYTVPATDSETCAVCLKDFLISGSKSVFTPCGHKFHGDCINQWLSVNCSRHLCPCPICRHDLDQFAVS